MDIKKLNEALNRALNEEEQPEVHTTDNALTSVCDFVNNYISHYPVLSAMFGTGRTCKNGFISFDQPNMGDAFSFQIFDGEKIDDYAIQLSKEQLLEYEIDDSNKQDYIILVNVDPWKTTIDDVIKKSDITSNESKLKIADDIFYTAQRLLELDLDNKKDYIV